MLPGRTVATQYSGWPFPCPCAFPVDATLPVCPGKRDPQFAFALHVASERDARGFQLCIGDPRAFECLQSKLAKINPEITRSGPLSAPRWAFRYFTRLGINGIKTPPTLELARVAGVAARQVVRALPQAALLSTDPTFYANFSVNRVGLGKAVINWRAQRVQWNFPFPVPFRTRNLSAVQSPEERILIPSAPKSIAICTAFFIARR